MAARRLQATWQILTIVTFLGLLWLPALDHFFKLDHARTPVENRRPAEWPKFPGLLQSRQFISQVEDYFNDHFGFRKRLIRWNNHWKVQLFHDRSGKDVLIGRDGWLFYTGSRMIEHWTREVTFSEQDLENWRRLLEMRRDWLRERGCKYLIAVPPDKHNIYPEYLPDWMEKSPKPRKVEQLAAYLKAHSTVEILDLAPALADGKKIRADYLKTDTHWNSLGAFIACRAVIQALASQYPGLEALPLNAYEWKPMPWPPGDLTIMLGRSDSFKETQALESVPLMPLPILKTTENTNRFPQRDPKRPKTCFTENQKGTGKAVVFRDSFASRWYPFLGQHFREVIYVWHYDWDRALIEREKPDVVIDEMLERFFNEENPVELARKDALSESAAPQAAR
jgi:hypothetical protein